MFIADSLLIVSIMKTLLVLSPAIGQSEKNLNKIKRIILSTNYNTNIEEEKEEYLTIFIYI